MLYFRESVEDKLVKRLFIIVSQVHSNVIIIIVLRMFLNLLFIVLDKAFHKVY